MGRLSRHIAQDGPFGKTSNRDIYLMQYVLLGKHYGGDHRSPGEARREERQDFSTHNFSQLLTKPPAFQAPSSPGLEAPEQPARAFCSIPRLFKEAKFA